jgi:hypothetical protein
MNLEQIEAEDKPSVVQTWISVWVHLTRTHRQKIYRTEAFFLGQWAGTGKTNAWPVAESGSLVAILYEWSIARISRCHNLVSRASLDWRRGFNLGDSTSAHQFWLLRIEKVLKSRGRKKICRSGADRGYGSSRGPPSWADWCRPWLEDVVLQVLLPSFKHGFKGHTFLLSGIVVSFCRDEACEKTKQSLCQVEFSQGLAFCGAVLTYKALASPSMSSVNKEKHDDNCFKSPT